jgi:hypothetical protein
VKEQMIKPKRFAEQQVADEADRKALNPVASRRTISDRQAEPEFRENHKRLKADRLARERLKTKRNKRMSATAILLITRRIVGPKA